MTMDPNHRHSRHLLFEPIGNEGQKKLASARVAIAGCGALGSRCVELLGRAGVGTAPDGLLRIIDRDYVDETNLQRQALFTEDDAKAARPKSAAAARHLLDIDRQLQIEVLVREIQPSNVMSLFDSVDLVIDGTDNFRARFLINDATLLAGIPWIYGGAVASRGVVAMFVPGVTPCFRCLMGEIPPLGSADSCDTAGIVTPLPAIVAGLQSTFAMRWIVSRFIPRGLRSFDLWSDSIGFDTRMESVEPDASCPSCQLESYPSLRAANEEAVPLCGRNSVQLYSGTPADLEEASRRFGSIGLPRVQHDQSVTATLASGRITIFGDGRIVIEGTTDPIEAKSIATRYLGG